MNYNTDNNKENEDLENTKKVKEDSDANGQKTNTLLRKWFYLKLWMMQKHLKNKLKNKEMERIIKEFDEKNNDYKKLIEENKELEKKINTKQKKYG